MSPETCLSCEGIERYLGEEEERVHALRGVSIDIEPGSVHAVVGPSGCGKSSLLYILGLLDLPDAGRVSIESEPVSQLSDDELAYKRSKFIGFIFQFHFLMEDFTAQENVMPAFGTNRNVMCYFEDIFIYLRARANDAVPRGRPQKHDDKPKSAAQAEDSCLGHGG